MYIKSSNKTAVVVILMIFLGSFSALAHATHDTDNQLTLPGVSTRSATDKTPSSAVVRGRIKPGGIAPTTYWVEWGVTKALGRVTPKVTDPRIDSFTFEQTLTNLNPDTKYYFRALGENQFGRDAGNIMSFTTKEFGEKTFINRKAQCNDDFDNDSDGLIDLRDPGCEDRNDDSEHTNFGFVDPRPTFPPPVASTRQATVLNATTAILNGQVSVTTSTGTNVWFEWSDSPQTLDQNSTRHQSNGFLPTFDFSDTLLVLKPNAVYYYRAVAANVYGISKGDVQTFTTHVFTTPAPAQPGASQPVGGTVSPVPTPIIPPIKADKKDIVLIKEVTNRSQPNGTSSAVAANAGDVVEFEILVRNTGTLPVTDLIVKDTVPSTLEFVNSSKGSLYSNVSNEVTWVVLGLDPEENVKLSFSTRAKELDSNALVSTRASVSGESVDQESNEAIVILNTSPSALAAIQGDDEKEGADKKSDRSSETAAAVSAFGKNILPSTLTGWIILAFLVLALLFLIRYIYRIFYKRGKEEKEELIFGEEDIESETSVPTGPTLIRPPGGE